MLKWAVNQPRPSYLAKELPGGAAINPMASAAAASTGAGSAAGSGSAASSYSEFHALRGKLKRKSLCLALAHGQGKENQLTSTPLPASSLSMQPRTPLLKDLSNIMSSPLTTPTPTLRPPTAAAAPSAYASTLPTFEAEYSPSAAIIPGPLLALRGMGIPDSYFEKPRYLEQKPLPLPLPLPLPVAQASAMKSGQTTLSSTQMGDVTLERMIDAILESTRKAPAPRQQRQRLRQRHHRHHPLSSVSSAANTATHSPTYRPAFDPASDLCEYWKSPHASGYEEREVRSPQPAAELPAIVGSQSQGKRRSLQLRRQRVVRRKRTRIATRISSSVRQSAQKLLAAARSAQKIRHISPDSGHNSTSDCDFEEEVDSLSSLGACGGLGLGLEAGTKRRLSFSFQEDLFVEK